MTYKRILLSALAALIVYLVSVFICKYLLNLEFRTYAWCSMIAAWLAYDIGMGYMNKWFNKIKSKFTRVN